MLKNSKISVASVPALISKYSLYIFAFTIPISFVPAEFAILFASIGWVAQGIVSKQWNLYKTPVFYPWLFYIGWNIFSAIISVRPIHTLLALADNEWPAKIMLLMLQIITRKEDLKKMLYLWLSTGTLAAVYALWQTFSGQMLHKGEALTPMGNFFRAVGFNGFYLTFAGFISSVFIISLCLAFQKELKARWKYVLVTLVSFSAMLGTFARSIWISLGIVLPLFGLSKGRKIGGGVVGVFLLVALMLLSFIPDIRERAYSAFVPSENQTRINLWKTSIAISQDHPWFGIGEDNFTMFFERYRVPGWYDTSVHPHNDYMTILVNSGIPGLISFLAIWGTIIYLAIKTLRRQNDGLLAEIVRGGTLAIIGFLIGSIFQNYYGTFANCWGWWFMAGCALTAVKLNNQEVKL